MSVPGYVRGSDTSRDAALSIASNAACMRDAVYRFIRARRVNGATCSETERMLGMRHQTASARIRELVLEGLLIDSGQRRKTESGRTAVVWLTKVVA